MGVLLQDRLTDWPSVAVQDSDRDELDRERANQLVNEWIGQQK
jgi:hypothetical protein